MAMTKNEALHEATKLVATGLQSGSIKLLGTTNMLHAVSAATADAAYLVKLLTELTASVAAMGE